MGGGDGGRAAPPPRARGDWGGWGLGETGRAQARWPAGEHNATMPERVLAPWGCQSGAGARAGQTVGDSERLCAKERGRLTPKFGKWTATEYVDLPLDDSDWN